MIQKYAIVLFLVISIAAAGCIQNPYPVGKLVTCSDFHQIVDKYQTPSEQFIIFDEGGTPPLILDAYNRYHIGGWTPKNEIFLGGFELNLTPINESVSGYRDACEVIP